MDGILVRFLLVCAWLNITMGLRTLVQFWETPQNQSIMSSSLTTLQSVHFQMIRSWGVFQSFTNGRHVGTVNLPVMLTKSHGHIIEIIDTVGCSNNPLWFNQRTGTYCFCFIESCSDEDLPGIWMGNGLGCSRSGDFQIYCRMLIEKSLKIFVRNIFVKIYHFIVLILQVGIDCWPTTLISAIELIEIWK